MLDLLRGLLERLGLSGGGRGNKDASKPDLELLMRTMKQLGQVAPDALKGVLKQNPGLTQMLASAQA